MNRLCGDCKHWHQDHTLDVYDRNEDTGELENLHFMGICDMQCKATDRVAFCEIGKQDMNDSVRQLVQAGIRAHREKQEREGYRIFRRAHREKTADAIGLPQICARYGLDKHRAHSIMEIAGCWRTDTSTCLWSRQKDIERAIDRCRDLSDDELHKKATKIREKMFVQVEGKGNA